MNMNIHRFKSASLDMASRVFWFLTPQGRINRFVYLCVVIFLSLSSLATIIAMSNFVELAYHCDHIGLIILLYTVSFLCFSLACFGVYLFFIFSMKRLQDFSEAGYWAILLFVPGINILLVFYLLLMPGDPTRNAHGFSCD